MRKLKLSLDALHVESFHAESVDPERGTVAAHSDPAECVSPWGTCEKYCTQDGSCNSCQGSCFGSCGVTCINTCGATCLQTCGCTGATECNCQTWETCLGAYECA
jgi:hypothetical protein